MVSKRRYGRSLTFIEDGFEKCLCNVSDLVQAAESLLAAGSHAPALSLSVLALEEMGKMYFIDGLLFSRPDDHKVDYFNKSQKKHNIKLSAIPMISLLSTMIARCDPRFHTEDIFRTAIMIGHENWKKAGEEVLSLSGCSDFEFLDNWKQRGFYVGVIGGNKFQCPRDGVDKSLAEAVHRFAKMSASNLDFSLSGGNLKRYMEQARSIRSKLSENDHETLASYAGELVRQLFDAE